MENLGKNESDDASDSSSDKKSEKTSTGKSTAKAREVGLVAGLAARERAADASARHDMPKLLERLLRPASSSGEGDAPVIGESKDEPTAEVTTDDTDTTTESHDDSGELNERIEAPEGEYTGPLIELEPGETIYIADQLVAEHQQELADKPDDVDPAEVAADSVQAKLLESIHDGLRVEAAEPVQVMETAAAQVATQVEDSLNGEATVDMTEPSADVGDETVLEPTAPETDMASDIPENVPLLPEGVSAATNESDHDATVEPFDPNATVPTLPLPGNHNNSTSAGNPNFVPPLPAIPSPNTAAFYVPPPPNPNYAYSADMPNMAPVSASPNTVSVAESAYEVRRAENRGLIIGGLIGYLVGRRRGRIKTEKRLIPIQRKLEKQVKELDTHLTTTEQEVRTLTTEKYRTADEAQRQALLERMRPSERPQLTPEQRQQVTIAEREEPKVQLQAAERALQQSVVQSAEKVLQTRQAIELIPRQRPAAEATRFDSPLRLTNEQVAMPAHLHVEQVQRMQARELAEVAEKVVIDGTSLRTIYESRRITEPGLRHVLTEYLQGGDVNKALTQELTIKEMTFERDPQSRDRIAATLAANVSGSSSSTTPTQTTPSLSSDQQSTHTTAASDASIHNSAADKKLGSKSQKNPVQDVLIRTWIAIVVVLVITVFVLLVR